MSNQGSVNPTRLQQNADVPGADAHPPRLGLAGDPLARDFVVDQYLPIVEALEERVVELQPQHLPEPLLEECDSLRF
jgi:hypothetical protein